MFMCYAFCEFTYIKQMLFFLNRNVISSFIHIICAFLAVTCEAGELFLNLRLTFLRITFFSQGIVH